MISPEEAWRRIEERLVPLPPEAVSRRQAAGRVLVEPLRATVDVPGHDVSAMDGYAVAGPVTAGGTYPVTGVIAAGDPPDFELAPDSAARIMTGAPVPPTTETVVPVELTDDGDETVRFADALEPSAHIRRRGEILRTGDTVLEAGRLLTPGAMSLVATHGYSEVTVRRRPSVAFATTGDEVVPPEVEPAPGQLRDSHSDFLVAAGASLGLAFERLGTASDDVDDVRRHLERGMKRDVTLVCGGVSMGEFDFVEDVLADLGCELIFDAVAVQPGKPLVAARHPGGWVFGLPGNPASVMVTFWLFVRPLLRRLQGMEDGYWQGALAGRLTAPLPAAKGRDRFLPAEIATVNGELHVRPEGTKGSHDLAAYSHGTALVRVPARSAPAEPGDACEVLPIG
jgi:molybdopterin molybdotransferase